MNINFHLATLVQESELYLQQLLLEQDQLMKDGKF